MLMFTAGLAIEHLSHALEMSLSSLPAFYRFFRVQLISCRDLEKKGGAMEYMKKRFKAQEKL